jgi:hypothetical protein
MRLHVIYTSVYCSGKSLRQMIALTMPLMILRLRLEGSVEVVEVLPTLASRDVSTNFSYSAASQPWCIKHYH